MQIPERYKHFISIFRSLRDLLSPHDRDVPAQASSSLVYTAVVLALLLAMLEIDLHQSELQMLWLVTDPSTVDSVFMGP